MRVSIFVFSELIFFLIQYIAIQYIITGYMTSVITNDVGLRIHLSEITTSAFADLISLPLLLGLIFASSNIWSHFSSYLRRKSSRTKTLGLLQLMLSHQRSSYQQLPFLNFVNAHYFYSAEHLSYTLFNPNDYFIPKTKFQNLFYSNLWVVLF